MNAHSTTEQLQALIDGELDAEEAERVFELIRHDPGLQAELAELQKLKYLVRSAYVDVGSESPPAARSDRRRRLGAVAAVAMLCLTVGWIARDLLIAPPEQRVAAAEMPAAHTALAATDDRVLIHLDKPDPSSWQVALDSVERLLAEDPARVAKVELLVNADGIGLLKTGNPSDTGPYTDRVRELAQRYPNLTLFACARGMQRLREKGIDVRLIDKAHTASSALEHVVDRLNKGWRYVGI